MTTAQDNILFDEIQKLKAKVDAALIPQGLRDKADDMITRLSRMAKYSGYSGEYEKTSHYIDWILNLPWQLATTDNLDLTRARQIMDKHHYGMDNVKERILQFMAILNLTKGKQEVSRAPILCLVGLVGTGKTTFGYALAEVMGRRFARIPFGGMGSSLDLRGQSRLHADSEPGQVIKALRRAGSNNPIILLDEIDRVSDFARADIMGVLVELLDPEQNKGFSDHYIDYPFNLSNVLFLATCNNTRDISTAVLDRMEIVQMPSYTDDEKIHIAREYILPNVMKKSGLTAQNLTIEENLWPKIVRPLGYDSGIRTLERTIKGICQIIAKFVVEGKGNHFYLTEDNIKQFLPTW